MAFVFSSMTSESYTDRRSRSRWGPFKNSKTKKETTIIHGFLAHNTYKLHMTTPTTTTTAQWLQTLELGYTGAPTSLQQKHCFACQTPLTTPNTCSQCHVAVYCSKACQVHDWKQQGHKQACAAYKRLGPSGQLLLLTHHSNNNDDYEDARNELLQHIRMYAFPYAIHQSQTLGQGFLFVQSVCTLAALTVPGLGRSVLLHYLTVGEYDAEVCRDDFELTAVRTALQQAVNNYDDRKQLVVLMRFRCGHVALGMVDLSLDYVLCQQLGREYYQNVTAGALELRLDDV